MKGYVYGWKRITDYQGRSTREEYFGFLLLHIIIITFIWRLDIFLNTIFFEKHGIITTAYQFIALFPIIALNARRLNDTNKGLVWIFLNLLPIIGNIWYFVLMLSPSTDRGYYPLEKQLPEAQEENRPQKIMLFFLSIQAIQVVYGYIVKKTIVSDRTIDFSFDYKVYEILQQYQIIASGLLFFSLVYVLEKKNHRIIGFIAAGIISVGPYFDLILTKLGYIFR